MNFLWKNNEIFYPKNVKNTAIAVFYYFSY